jgi:hypothetical protein
VQQEAPFALLTSKNARSTKKKVEEIEIGAGSEEMVLFIFDGC